MPAQIRAAFDAELRHARTATTSGQRWAALERAHILSQPWAWPHTRAHAVMLALAWSEHDWSVPGFVETGLGCDSCKCSVAVVVLAGREVPQA